MSKKDIIKKFKGKWWSDKWLNRYLAKRTTKMTEEQIKMLGFEKQTDESDDSNTFYYYTLTITQGLELISNANDEVKDDKWFIEFFDTEIPVRYYDYYKVKSLIEIIKDGMIKTNKDE